MAKISQNGVCLNCRATTRTDGSQCALLIHGLNTNMAFWHPLLVRRLANARRVVMFDLRGHGYSDLPAAGYTSAHLAEDALAVLDAYGIETADLVAHSFGAVVALQVARLAPQRVGTLVVLDGRIRLLQPELRLGDWSQFEPWRRHFAEVGISIDPDLELDFRLPFRIGQQAWSRARDGLVADGFFVPHQGKRSAQKYHDLLTKTSAAEELTSNAGLERSSLRQISAPALAVYGSLSPYLPTRDGLLQQLPHCASATVPDVGHNFPFLRPEKTAEIIEAFWRNRSQRSVPV